MDLKSCKIKTHVSKLFYFFKEIQIISVNRYHKTGYAKQTPLVPLKAIPDSNEHSGFSTKVMVSDN